MRGLIAALALVALSGCLSPTATGFRDQDVPMSSIVTLDLIQFSGRWYEVEAFVPDGKSCVIGAVTFTRQKNGDLTVTEGPCADGAPRSGLARSIGPGRFAFAGDELWVLWVDATYHTAVIGTPSGAAHVLSRELTLPPDRQIAVHEILAWNGFDVSKLRPSRRR
ncbi:lipocalin family protein [Celeribacter litoreus]|uniref:lipocalin family protein n=1 Tax=Celeribacter litoreus TaxID=2876714 RepID=UPI001CD03FBA|nr:lipocalin family protein [Celeribacter litoreus]MCA0045144.1 lipocalin family protein [Celeribacter litoreus]